MAEQPQPEKRTIEMRLAEIEDKLSQLHISEEDLKTYQRVSNALAMGGQVPATAAGAQQVAQPFGVRGFSPIRPIIRWNCACICPCGPCYECTCGPCIAGGGSFGGGFGGFGG